MTEISKLTKESVARKIDYALLVPTVPENTILEAFEDLKKYKFGAIYVLPYFLPLAVCEIGDFCKKNDILIGCGPSFPFGVEQTKIKLYHAEHLIKQGCTAMDLMTNISALKDKKYDYYLNEMKQIADLCHANNVLCKAITEVCYLTDEEIITSTKLVAESGMDYLKTSTGAGPKGIPSITKEIKMIQDILRAMNAKTKLKVSGVNDPKVQNAYAFFAAGVDIIGTQSAVQIVEGLTAIQELGIFR